MKRFLVFIYISLCTVAMASVAMAADEWRIYASYHNATKAVKCGSRIFVLANGDLFSYDTEDETVETYDKVGSLSGFGIKDMVYEANTRQLVLVYEDGNIDLLGMDGEVWNMPDMKNTDIADKTLNDLIAVDGEAFICINSGLVVIDLKERYYVALYQLGKVTGVAVQDGKIYAKTGGGVLEGDRAANLLDLANWKASTANIAFGKTEEEKATEAELLQRVESIVINSPIRNYSYKLNMQGNRLLVAGGNFYYPEVDYTGTAMKYEGGKWIAFDEEEPLKLVGASSYRNVTDVVQDPNDTEHHWLGTKCSGIYEFRDYKLTNHYTYDNSPLRSILPNSSNARNYVRVTALQYDAGGNLWMCNNQRETIVHILKKDGTWTGLYYDEVAYFATWDNIYFDSRGWAWINSRRSTNTSSSTGVASQAGLLVVNTNGTIDKQSDDQHTFFGSFYNQDGTRYTPNLFYCAVEDADGEMWIGTNEGVFVSYDPKTVFSNDFYLSQVKVPRNDGSNLADYLLNGIGVKCIAIDGGNRKWIGTVDDGVYLISADGLATIEHFTTENSPLISNEINDIAINGENGEVFIATSKGLCSYMGDATDPATSMKSDNLKVFPNPVRPEYQGDVHITGLMYNSEVKIVSAAGKLVAKGVSAGGEFSWNCCYQTGKRVASGIYYALCTDEKGNEGACAKILIIK
ncbi:MAG: Por secretion system protein [Prevotellaceae bacterium]|nr:Por secretion system protein [Prevotellaceae bacterium]